MIDAVDILCAQLTRDLFAIGKFLFLSQSTCNVRSIQLSTNR